MDSKQPEDLELESGAGIEHVVLDPHVYHLPRHRLSDQPAVDNPRWCSSRAAFQTQAAVVVIGSVLVIVLSVAALLTSCSNESDSSDGGWERDGVEAVPFLCAPCRNVQEGDRETTTSSEEGAVLCCLLDCQRLAAVFSQVYDIEITSKTNTWPVPDKSDGLKKDRKFSAGEISERKPSAHIGLEVTDEDFYFNETAGTCMHTVKKWQEKETNEVLLGSYPWGIDIPTSGLYNLHSSANFVFNNRQEKTHRPVWAVHQIMQYNARTRQTAVLAQRRQSVSATYKHGMASSLVTLAELGVGDIVSVGFSSDAVTNLVDCGLGLFMVQ